MARRSKPGRLTGDSTMIGRSLTRRLEDLETQLLPAVGQRRIFIIDFVDSGGKVVNSREITFAAPPPNEPSQRARPWRR
jgi:hypothetical protein